MKSDQNLDFLQERRFLTQTSIEETPKFSPQLFNI